MPRFASGDVAGGAFHSLVVTSGGQLYAWGNNTYGQVGDGSTVDRHKPILILKEGIRCAAAGKCHSLAVTTAGEVLAWGSNQDCLLGTGWKVKQLEPAQVIQGGVKEVAAGVQHNLAITDDGEVLAWGANDYGQLGDGTKAAQRAPIKVALPGAASAVAAGWYHSLALMETGQVLTWGFNTPDKSGFRTHGVPVPILSHGISMISAGSVHSLALTDTGILLAWGGNEKGQLGDGTADKHMTPVPVRGRIEHASAGSYHSLAIDAGNHILVWGFSAYSLPGEHSESMWRVEFCPQTVPLDVDTFPFHSIFAGGGHSLAVSLDGEVFAWGGNASGQVGDGSTIESSLPKMILGPGTISVKSHKDIVAELLKGPAELEEDFGPERTRRSHARTQAATAAGTLAVPEIMLRAAGIPGREGLVMTQPGLQALEANEEA